MKAILIIDKPKNCFECQFRVIEYDGYYKHYTCQSKWTKGSINEPEKSMMKMYVNCPLKPIPQKIGNVVLDTEGKPIVELNSFGIGKAYINGYNHAIREILGEEE